MNVLLIFVLFIGVACFGVAVFRDIGIAMIFNPDALLIVVGGTTVAVFVGFPLQRIQAAARAVFDAFKGSASREALVGEVVEIARRYRRGDIRELENNLRGIKDDLLRLGVSLLINYRSENEIRDTMEREMAFRMVNYNFSQNLLKTIARLTPSFGLAGTVISLIKMFKNLQSIDAIAPLMAVALMSTFYGVILSNLIMLPLSAKLKDKAIVSESLMLVTIEGVIAVNNGEHPLKIEEKMRGNLDRTEAGLSVAPTQLAVTKTAGRP